MENRQNPLLFRFISHKVLRLLLPLPLVLMLITSGLARGSFYRLAFREIVCLNVGSFIARSNNNRNRFRNGFS